MTWAQRHGAAFLAVCPEGSTLDPHHPWGDIVRISVPRGRVEIRRGANSIEARHGSASTWIRPAVPVAPEHVVVALRVVGVLPWDR